MEWEKKVFNAVAFGADVEGFLNFNNIISSSYSIVYLCEDILRYNKFEKLDQN